MSPSPFDPRAGFYEHASLAALRLAGYQSIRVPTRSGRLHVLRGKGAGDGAPVILLHGFSSAGVHYRALMRRLRPHVRHLIAPDAPGHGFSPTPSGLLSLAEMQEGLVEALDQVSDKEPAIVYGNSMGGLLALRYALARPERVRGLVLCSPVGAPMTAEEMKRFLRRFRVDDHVRALAFVNRVFDSPGPLRHLLAWGVRRKFGHPTMKALLSALEPDFLLGPEDVRGLRPPVLFVWGRSERVLPPEHKEFFLAHLPPGSRVEEPPRFGHGPYLTHPDAVAEQILAFARSLAAADRPAN
ncbi:MAG: alpha/beta fold hydrolase [Deltaproteobacteria bacterium]|nr:alpha/beta fold hydrolase [Deltaproteobacteria bacterium]